ncbi:MAG: flagellin lysine-N-methylase [Clostridia bacterium]|nr:flagellin lysine-N-methylase [Clostridia bacterium]
MKLLAPKYYLDFSCIADKCKHSCCIGWEIDIDEKTMKKYSSLEGEYSENIRNSIEMGETPHFKLAQNERCPHLNEKGLCKIILNCGENCLCDICREHPRFYNFTNAGKEVGIGLSCEEACRIIINSNSYDQMMEIGECDGEIEKCEFDAIAERERIYGILKDINLTFEGKLEMIYDYYDIYLNEFPFYKIIDSLEYLNEDHKKLFSITSKYFINFDMAKQLERILAYFIYRHCSEACDYDDFYASLCFSLVCTSIISSISLPDTLAECARIVSEEIEYSEKNTDIIKSLFI